MLAIWPFCVRGIAACVLERRGDPACPPSPLFRQARSLEAAIPSSWAIWLKGRPLLASSPTASRGANYPIDGGWTVE